jgi:hypothetical protein
MIDEKINFIQSSNLSILDSSYYVFVALRIVVIVVSLIIRGIVNSALRDDQNLYPVLRSVLIDLGKKNKIHHRC